VNRSAHHRELQCTMRCLTCTLFAPLLYILAVKWQPYTWALKESNCPGGGVVCPLRTAHRGQEKSSQHAQPLILMPTRPQSKSTMFRRLEAGIMQAFWKHSVGLAAYLCSISVILINLYLMLSNPCFCSGRTALFFNVINDIDEEPNQGLADLGLISSRVSFARVSCCMHRLLK